MRIGEEGEPQNRSQLGDFQALAIGAVLGLLMKAAHDPEAMLLIDVEPVTDELGFTDTIEITGRESREVLELRITPKVERTSWRLTSLSYPAGITVELPSAAPDMIQAVEDAAARQGVTLERLDG